MGEKPDKIVMTGVSVLIRRDDQVLLIKRRGSHGAGTWACPGGHIDFGETPEACGERETREEVGLAIAGLRFIGITNDVFEAEGKHYITIWMEARYVGGFARAYTLAPEHLRQAHWRGFDAAMASAKTRLGGHPKLTRGLHKSGQKLYVEMSFALVLDDAGSPLGSVAVARDATERVAREKAAAGDAAHS